MNTHYLQCGRYRLPIGNGARPLVMGILNITPDSFSDGGRFNSVTHAVTHAEQMIAAGVDIIDIGGESTRPGTPPLSLEEELSRVLPVMHALRDCGKPLSIDTYKPEVMRQTLAAGADMINDINAFRAPEALSVVKESQCALCIMHMLGEPLTMQDNPRYENVVEEVALFLRDRLVQVEQNGIGHERICIDPGFGFGKTLEDNLVLLRNLHRIVEEFKVPVLAGLSRKSTVGAIVEKPVEHRLAGSIAAALAAVAQGAQIVRVHDVAETVDALKVWQAANNNEQGKQKNDA